MPSHTTSTTRRRAVRRGQTARRSERGAITAELAISLPVLLTLLLLGVWAIGLVIVNIRCIDAARDVARAAARGDPPEQAEAIGHRTIPDATITITRTGQDIHVTVRARPSHGPPLLGDLLSTELSADATLRSEGAMP